jgi:hypothetical protein
VPAQPRTTAGGQLSPLTEVGTETGFAWTCRRTTADDGTTATEPHQITSNDRAEYERHMRGHGLKPVKSTYQRPRPWKPPRPAAEHTPALDGAGQRIEWVTVTEAHWDGRHYDLATGTLIREGTWVPETRDTRTGTIWSVADTPSAWWVQPDDDPAHPVYVKRAGKRDRGHGEGALYEIPGAGEAARANVLRGELIRKRGIFPVTDTVINEHTAGYYGNGSSKRVHVMWHSDPACPRAQGKERYDPASPAIAYGFRSHHDTAWTPLDAAQALASGQQPPSCLCPHCITGLDTATPAAPATTPAHHPQDGGNGSNSDSQTGDDNTTRDADGSRETASSPGQSPPSAGDARRRDPGRPAPRAAVPAPAAAPARAGRILRLERPPTDTEFLRSCAQLAETLTRLAAEVTDWADGLARQHLPQPVLTPLHELAGLLTGASAQAIQAGQAFAARFEDARQAAARGLRITGDPC